MAEKQEIEALLGKVQEAGAKNLLVVYTTREGNQTSLEHVGLSGPDLINVSAYIRYRLDRAVNAFFSRQADINTPAPLMHGPKNDILPVPPNSVPRAVRRAIVRANQKTVKKGKKK